LDEVKRLKEENKHCQNQEKERILDEETTKILEEEIYKKVEESLNTDEVKSEMQSRIEEGMLEFDKWGDIATSKGERRQDSRRSPEDT
jgi:hypothetical protein